jgi:hypothetical protein
MGLVQVDGAIELNQFFPVGRSDADTTNVRATSFRYVEVFGGAPINLPWMTTARVRGEGTHAVLSHVKGRGALELTRSDGQVGYAARRSVCQVASFSFGVR